MEDSLDLDVLTVERLLAMSPLINGIDKISMAARQLLMSYVKYQPNVRDTFFPNHELSSTFEPKIDPNWFDFEQFSTLYVCQTLCKLEDEYKIHAMLNSDKVDEMLQEMYTSPDWKKLGLALYSMLFVDLVTDAENALPFRAYIENDRRHWASQIIDKTKEAQWIYSVVTPIVKGQYSEKEYNRDMNILFIKLHLLDPTSVMPTYNSLRKALPDLNLEVVTTNYLGKPLDWKYIEKEVEEAVSKATYPRNASKASLQEIEIYHGVEVTEFVMHDAKYLGLISGKYADNKRISRPRDRCSVM